MYTPTVILTTLFAATVATAATLQPRQIGNLACNAARLGVVGALNDAGDAVSQIQDPDTQAAAQAGLDQANDGVQQVAQSIFSGEKASADGRDGVAAGLQAMTDALASGDR